MANMAALAVARRAKAPPEISTDGAQSCSRALRVYASAEVHHSIAKAAALLGIGRNNVRMIGVDERYKINLDALVTANEKLGTTTLLITHNADIARIGDRVVRFADGLIRSIERNEQRIAPRELNW